METTLSRHMRAVELDKILAMLAKETGCEDAAELALALTPAQSVEQARALLKETDDAYVLTARFGSPSFYGMRSVTNALRRAQAGGVLNLTEFLAIDATLHSIRAVKEWRSRSEGMTTVLDGLFSALTPNKFLEERIEMTVRSEEEVADTASAALAGIRRKIAAAALRVKDKLDSLRRSNTYQKYLQESIVTLREGRYVVPVKAEYKNEVPGLVHDTSSSGATLFIEPLAVVEANNEIKVLQSEERDEIERILAELSAQAGEFADGIITAYQAAVQLNLIFAKASLAFEMKATMPAMNDRGRLVLKSARHPLISKGTVVPTDISLGQEFDTLVITGPNTGGKTVSLKTIGLLTLMAMCGLMLPVAEGSEVSFFEKVLVDVGDEQSIEQSLSTFSAHMTNIIRILQQADEHSLVLLDELGAGTDPVEGAALATSILEALRQKDVRMAATTHYAELKAYALQTPGVENGCCEFDVSTLRPTYRLLIGVPGRSNAFAISLRLGMSQEIVDRARELVSAEDTRFENVVEKLETSRVRMEQEQQQVSRLRHQAQSDTQQARELVEQAQQQAKKEIEEAHTQAARIVSMTRGQADALLAQIDEMRRQANRELSAEQKARLKAGIRELESTADPIFKRPTNEGYVLPRPLKVGDSVLIFDIDKNATVLQLDENAGTATVQAGLIKTRVDISNLRLLDGKKIVNAAAKNQRPQRTVTKDTSARRPTSELDLRGQMVQEALMNLDSYLDHAIMQGLGQVTVIHGKGTGALRTAVHQFLKTRSGIKSYRLGVFGEGENGVTIVELK